MEEDEFKNFYRDMNQTSCVYQKAILSARCECPHARKLNIAEREAVACEFVEAREQCQSIYNSFIEKARFALRKLDNSPLTHSEAIKVQVGGIIGLQEILADKSDGSSVSGNSFGNNFANSSGNNVEILRVGNLTMKAFLEYPDLKNLPIDTIVRAIVHCEVRKRKRSSPNIS